MSVTDFQHTHWREDARRNIERIDDEATARMVASLCAGMFSIAERMNQVAEGLEQHSANLDRAQRRRGYERDGRSLSVRIWDSLRHRWRRWRRKRVLFGA